MGWIGRGGSASRGMARSSLREEGAAAPGGRKATAPGGLRYGSRTLSIEWITPFDWMTS
jgi:hypothetical protein